ncbi:MAG: ribosomal protein S18-alanine N-acetyltransferase [candidate division WOR-3 bacterium]
MKNPLLRRAKLKDIPEIFKIEKEVFPDPWSFYSFLFELKNPDNYFYVIEIEKKVIGYIIAGEYEESYHLKNIAIKGECQGKGYGKFLLNNLIEKAKKEGKKYIFLEVRAKNERAIKFYEKYGFKRNRLLKGYYGYKEDGYEYVLELEESK